ncbi:MAG: nucleotidyltransferase domain-containing protein [Nanoarchaeota archaeon]|nr:nucleotidyltransferase domain-containing protein [Nanoarchaeota archaeon]
MLTKDQIKVLQALLRAITAKLIISDIARELNQKYPQTYRTIKILEAEGLVKTSNIGKSSLVELDLTKYHPEYAIAELDLCKQLCKKKELSIVLENIIRMNRQFACILFGSYAAGKGKKDSDIDLLFIIPEEYDYGNFEKIARRQLAIYNCDINITTEKGLLEMWATPGQLNVGNEILERHVVLYNAERFITLLRQHHVG